MPITGIVEEAGQFGIRGWLSRDTPAQFAPSVDIVVNRRLAAIVPSIEAEPSRYRFSFNPFESLRTGPNSVEVFVSGMDQIIEGGVFSIDRQPLTRTLAEDLSCTGQTCEHCFPSVAVMLSRIYSQLKPGSVATLDFLCAEPAMKSSYATFADDGTFTRIYSELEMRSFLLDVGFEILDLSQSGENRVQVQAKKPEAIR